MQNISEFINEALILEKYNAEEICDKIESIDGFNTKPNARKRPKEVYVLRFSKTTGKVLKEYTFDNNLEFANDSTVIWVQEPELESLWSMRKHINDCSLSVDIISNTKKGGIVIGYFNKENTELIKQFVKDNLNLFDIPASSMGLTEDEIDQLDKFFKLKVKNYESKISKTTFAAYFPSVEDAKKMNRLGYDRVPHITISRPNSYKGNLKVTSYRSGNYAPTEWPDLRRMMNSDGTPKYANVDSIIQYLEDNILQKSANKLGIELK